MPLLRQWSRLFVSLLVGILSESECLCPTLGMFCAWIVVHNLPVSLRRVDHLVSGVMMAVVVGRVYGWPIEPHFFLDLPNIRHQPLWWWCRQQIHALMHLWLWCPLLRGLMLQDGLLGVVYPPVGVRIGVVSLGHLCPNIHPGLDCFLGLFTPH